MNRNRNGKSIPVLYRGVNETRALSYLRKKGLIPDKRHTTYVRVTYQEFCGYLIPVGKMKTSEGKEKSVPIKEALEACILKADHFVVVLRDPNELLPEAFLYL